MKKLTKIKLTALNEQSLNEKEMNELTGGCKVKPPKPSPVACEYVGAGYNTDENTGGGGSTGGCRPHKHHHHHHFFFNWCRRR